MSEHRSSPRRQSADEPPPRGWRAAGDSRVAVPGRMLLLEFLADSKCPVAPARIRAHFNLNRRAAAEAVAGRLERMRAAGLVLKDRKGRYALPREMDIVAGRVSGHANGYGFVIPDDASGDLFLHHRQMRKVLHGDRVLARVKNIDSRGRKEGVVVEVMVDPQREIIGHFHLESGIGFVEPDDSRFARDLTIPAERRHAAEDGDIVAARVIRHPAEHHHAVGEVVEVLGRQLQPGMETDIAIRKHGIPGDWPGEVRAELDAMKGALQGVKPDRDRDAKSRRDLRDLPLVTIDGEDARDFDDAVYGEPISGGADGGGWRLVVAIADVGHYVRAGTALDREALKRGNSVYFPSRVVPMLPPELSNGICSLNPFEDRYCMVCDMRLNARGEITAYRFYPGLMHSRARLTYRAVHDIVARRTTAARRRWKAVAPHLDHLREIARALGAQRKKRGSIDFDFPEAFIEFDSGQKIRRIARRERTAAHRLIEECMLAANGCAARFLQERPGHAAIYRNHHGPSADSLVELRRFLSGLGLTLGGGDAPQAAHYAALVSEVAGRSEVAPVVQMLLLRSLSQAEYAAGSAGHFALACPVYTHFTSPIRRSADLVVHRQIRRLLGAGKSRQPVAPTGVSLEKIAEQCSFTERRAEDASRDVLAWLKAEFMQDKIGEVFDGVVSGVAEFGVFVQLNDLFIDGLVHVTGLGDDYYHFDPLRFQLTGQRTARKFRLGDPLRVSIAAVSLENAKIDFELCADDNRPAPAAKKRRKHRSAKNPPGADLGASPKGLYQDDTNKSKKRPAR